VKVRLVVGKESLPAGSGIKPRKGVGGSRDQESRNGGAGKRTGSQHRKQEVVRHIEGGRP